MTWLAGPTLAAKRLGLLHELVPAATVIAVLVNPTNPTSDAEASELLRAAQVLGVRLHILNASTDRDIDLAFVNVVRQRAGALLVATDAFLNAQHDQLAALATRNAVRRP